MTADPDRACPHDDIAATVEISRLQRADDDPTIVAYLADLRVECVACGEPFRFSGVAAGLSYTEPRVSVDGRELHAPMRPASADDDFGLGLPSFRVNFLDLGEG
jgi:hypothetical protein